MIRCIKGVARHHPLWMFMMPSGENDVYKLDEEALRNSFPTQPDEDVMDDVYATAYGEMELPGGQASPLEVRSSSEDELIDE